MLRTLRFHGLAALVALSLTACTRTVYITEDPPPPQVEVKPAAPSARHTWVDGHWKWNGNRYVWVSGHWEKSRGNKTWVAGHWNKTGHGWRWVPGHWK
jgi:hypothetical protein